ncbi:MAG: SDR family NAD(P)-dependent oxidoreductase [Melioribacteraceae bacterium]
MDKKKIVWITGASSGIGKALAVTFAGNGIHVAATARRIELLEEIKKELGESSSFYQCHQLDISDNSSVNDFYDKISADHEIDCVINNAGTTSFKNGIDNSIGEIEEIIKVNLLGSIYAIKSVLPGMIERKSGTIINILSVVTQKVFIASSAYSASKSGLHAYAKVLREEVRDKNIRVINVSPGATATAIWPEGALRKYSERMMDSADIARLIFRVFSEKSNLVSEELVIRPIKGDL